jgi:hypothetical protein
MGLTLNLHRATPHLGKSAGKTERAQLAESRPSAFPRADFGVLYSRSISPLCSTANKFFGDAARGSGGYERRHAPRVPSQVARENRLVGLN